MRYLDHMTDRQMLDYFDFRVKRRKGMKLRNPLHYRYIIRGFPKKNITRMPDVAVRRYIDVTRARRWLYWAGASKSGQKWLRIWR